MDKDFDNDLSTKMEALLARHRTNDAELDRNIPILTEVVAAPGWKPAQPHLKKLDDDQLDALSQAIFNRVLARLDGELGTRIEEQLTEHLAAQINTAVTHVVADMRQNIANEIGDAINEALASQLRN